MAPRPLVHDQVRQRGELLGGVRRLRRAPPRRRRPPSTGSAPTARRSSSSTSARSPTSTSASTTPTPSTGTSPSPRRSTSCSTAPSSRPGAATAASPSAAAATGPTPACSSPTAPSTSGCSASTATWLDLSGSIEGGEAGVLLLDHPHNHRHPVPWYASTKAATYGDEGWSNFANAAFLWHAPLEWPAARRRCRSGSASSSTTARGTPTAARPSGSATRMADRPPFPGAIARHPPARVRHRGARRPGRRHARTSTPPAPRPTGWSPAPAPCRR